MNGAIVRRSYSIGSQNLNRLVQGESLKIEVSFRSGGLLPDEVVVEFERRFDEWRGTVELSSIDHTFRGTAIIDAPGLLRAKAKYRFDGEPWISDNSPFAYFLVDPANAPSTRMYTMYPGSNGTIREDWIPRLTSIKDLGYNTVHLLPVTEMGPSMSPYAASDPLQIDPAYSSAVEPMARMKDFRAFVDACVDLEMRLCVDLVFNHIAVEGSLAKQHNDWLSEDPTEQDGIKRSGWYDGYRWHKWQDLGFLNYKGFNENNRRELWDYMTNYALFWSSIAAETGGMIRLDNLHSGTREFMRHVLQRVRREYPEIVILAELFTSPDETTHLTFEYGINYLLATTWEHKFVPQLRRYLMFVHSGSPSLRYLAPVTSHDSGSPAEEFGSVLSTIPRLAMATLMSPGPSGIVQGVEYGLEKKVPFIGPPEKTDFAGEHDFRDLIITLNGLLTGMPFLSVPGNMRFIDGDHDAILGVIRTGPEDTLLACANFDTSQEQQILLPEEVARTIADKKPLNELNGRPLSDNLDGSVLSLPAAGCVAALLP